MKQTVKKCLTLLLALALLFTMAVPAAAATCHHLQQGNHLYRRRPG